MRLPDPWRILREQHPHVLVLRLPISERGRYYAGRDAIILRTGLAAREATSTLWHELVHAERRDTPSGDAARDRAMEGSCWREAARRALPIRILAVHVASGFEGERLARELKVTRQLLNVRLRYLHPAERGELRRARILHDEIAAAGNGAA